jgi:hypothetical protein
MHAALLLACSLAAGVIPGAASIAAAPQASSPAPAATECRNTRVP